MQCTNAQIVCLKVGTDVNQGVAIYSKNSEGATEVAYWIGSEPAPDGATVVPCPSNYDMLRRLDELTARVTALEEAQ